MFDALGQLARATYINLDSRTDRLAHIEALFSDAIWHPDRTSAVRYDALTDNVSVRHKTRGAVAVASIWQSHKNVLCEFLDNEEDGLFVTLEDDLRMKKSFWESVFPSLPDDWRMLMVSPRYRTRASDDMPGSRDFVPPPHGSNPVHLPEMNAEYHCTGAHFLIFRNKSAVQSIVHEMDCIRDVYDVDVFFSELHGVYGYNNDSIGAGGFGSDHV